MISTRAMIRLGLLTLVCGLVFLSSLVVGCGLIGDDLDANVSQVRDLLRIPVVIGLFGSPLGWLYGISRINFRD